MDSNLRARQHVYAHIVDKGGADVAFNTYDSGALTLASPGDGFTDENGFFIILAAGATEGLLYVMPWREDTYRLVPFFVGRNRLMLKSVLYNASQTATDFYYER